MSEVSPDSNHFVTTDVVWDGQYAGSVTLLGPDSSSWEWKSGNTFASRVMEGEPGELPNFIRFLTVEGELAAILNGEANTQSLVQNGLRFLCNVRMGVDEACLLKIVRDEIDVRLDECMEDGLYTGQVFLAHLEGEDGLTKDFTEAVRRSYESIMTPKFSGFQLKMPMTLSKDEETGEPQLFSAEKTPFTHILKFGRISRLQETIPIAEWVGMELSEACGLETPSHALVKFPKGKLNLGLDEFGILVERFDIRDQKESQNTSYLLADMCNITGIEPNSGSDLIPDKYKTPIETAAQGVLSVSSDPEADARTFFKRVALGYFMADMDMHMKNISMLKTVDKENETINTRMSPTYDAVPTRVYPDQRHVRINTQTSNQEVYYEPDDSMALPINGKYNDFTEDDFIDFAATIGIDAMEAQDILLDMASTCAERAIEIAKNPPDVLKDHRDARFILWRVASEVADQVQSLTQMEFYRELGENYLNYQDYKTFSERFQPSSPQEDSLDLHR